MLSGAIAGYPSAVLVGWGETLENPHTDTEVPATQVIRQIRKRLYGRADDDVFLIVDAYTSVSCATYVA